MMAKLPQEAREISDKIATTSSSDVLLINAPFEPGGVDWALVKLLSNRALAENVVVILVSNGGDAATAYRVARTLQRSYQRIVVFVPGWCKSAGTLCAIGAHELIIGDKGELGPLDVQVRQKDELGERSSGLVVSESLNRLQLHAFELFQKFMLEIKERSYGAISFRLAADIAAKMTVGLLEPLYRQIDPVQIGDLGRAMSIAKDYALRLMVSAGNLSEDGLNALIQTYASHDFVIDRREACELFQNVRQPTPEEASISEALGDLASLESAHLIVQFLSTERKPKNDPATGSDDCHRSKEEAKGNAGTECHSGDPGGAEAP